MLTSSHQVYIQGYRGRTFYKSWPHGTCMYMVYNRRSIVSTLLMDYESPRVQDPINHCLPGHICNICSALYKKEVNIYIPVTDG